MSDQTPTPPNGYIQLELQLDTDQLTLTGMEYMESAFEGWERNPGNPDTIMIEGAGEIAGELYEQGSQMPPEAMARIGTSIYNVPILEGTPAQALAHFVFDNMAQPGLIDAGTYVQVPHPSGQAVLFETLDDLNIIQSTTVDGWIVASSVGSAANGAFGDSQLVDPVEGLVTITVETSADGSDDETATDYLNRLSTVLTIMTPRPVLPNDHAVLVANGVDGIGRATAIDLLCPGTASVPTAIRDPAEVEYFQGKTPPASPPTANLTNEPRCTTVAIMPVGGGVPSQALMQDAWNLLDANREVNFLNYVIAPSYVVIDVKGQIHPYPGFNGQDVIDAVITMIQSWLNPEIFGSIPGPSSGKDWSNQTIIHHDEAVDYVNRAAGVFWSQNIQMRVSGGAWTAGDIAMTGLAPLPAAGDLSGFTIV